MVKIEQENTVTPLNLVYGKNHFELTKINSDITNILIHIHNDHQKKTINHNMNVNNKTKTCD